jgi:predicted nucleotide-binding protein
VTEPATDQQIVVHLFAPAAGPRAEAAYGAIRELWLGCRQVFLMRDPVPGTGLSHQLAATYRELPSAAESGAEAALAAQERPDADCQAILRRHHDVLNLSLVLARPEGAAPPGSGHSWWQDLDSQWSFLSERLTADLLGEARVYLARSAAPPGPRLDDLLPAAARIGQWGPDRAAAEGRLALWEALPWADGRALRRLVLAFGDDTEAHHTASAWAWSNGETAIPPLARYLLHAAKLRQLYRGWQHADDTRELAAAVQAQVTRLREAPPEQLADGALAGLLRRKAGEARLRAADLRELRQAAEIAKHNMELVGSSPGLLAPAGPFADDKNLAYWFLGRLGDEVSSLGVAADRAAFSADLLGGPLAVETAAPPAAATSTARAPRPGGPVLGPDEIARNVFVVHGRDEQARDALFGFLRALGLQPLGWETLVSATGNTSPYLRDVIIQGIAMAQAAVVLMTPDDIVRLHPDLQGPDDDEHEERAALQARPNVILELGMALATYADRTIVLFAGRHRPMADLGGLNYIRLYSSEECMEKIIRRLQTARCEVREDAPDWRARAWFSGLTAYTRQPRIRKPPRAGPR